MRFSCYSSAPLKHVQVLVFFLIMQLMSLWHIHAAAGRVVVGNVSRVEDAQYFHVYYGQSFKVIKNGIDGKTYLLMQNNSRMATKTRYCTGRIKSFVIPLSNYSVDTTDFPVSFFELLGMLDGLKGITSDALTSQCTLKSLSNGNITMVNSTDIKEIQLFAAHFVSSTDQVHACNSVTFAPLSEVTPLKRAEWIKYLGTFANAEVRANAVYDAVKSNYICISKVAANQTLHFKPVVAWIKYSEVFIATISFSYINKSLSAIHELHKFTPSFSRFTITISLQGIWSFAKEEYKKQYVTDAGGENVDEAITGSSYNVSIPEDMEEYHAILCTVDVVVDETYAAEPAEYTLSSFLSNINVSNFENSCFEFLANKSIWRYDKRARNSDAIDWFDGGISQPQLVLADLLEALFPTGNYTTTYFRNVAKGESVTNIDEAMCDRSSSTALEPTIVPCRQ